MEFKERKRWVFFGLPFTFTVYKVKENGITINMGFLNKQEEDCYMYKVQDVTLKASLFERMFGLGTIVCHTGDTTNPTLWGIVALGAMAGAGVTGVVTFRKKKENTEDENE